MEENNQVNEKSWELVNTEMHQAYEEHRAASQRALNVIKQWLLVVAFPFIVLGSSMSFLSEATTKIDITTNWMFSIPLGYRPFFVFSGIMGMLLIILHNDIDMHKHVCRNGMNAFRKLYKKTLKKEFEKINWVYKMRTDFTPIKINFRSFTFWFAIFGGAVSGLYCAVGFGFNHFITILFVVTGASIPQIIMFIKLSKENKKHNIEIIPKVD